MSHYAYILTLEDDYQNPDHWNDHTTAVIQAHFQYLQHLFQTNQILFVGRTNYEPGHPHLQGWAVLNTDDETIAKQIMEQDPCVVHKVMQASLHPFNAVLYNSKDKV